MSLEKLVSKYIASAEHVFSEMKIVETCTRIDASTAKKIVEVAKAYLEDAKYYRDKKKKAVSLASVAYCEGLLDTLKLVGAVKFEWSVKKKETNEK